MDETAAEEVLLDGNAEARAYDFYMPSGIEVKGSLGCLPICVAVLCSFDLGIAAGDLVVLSSLKFLLMMDLPQRRHFVLAERHAPIRPGVQRRCCLAEIAHQYAPGIP